MGKEVQFPQGQIDIDAGRMAAPDTGRTTHEIHTDTVCIRRGAAGAALEALEPRPEPMFDENTQSLILTGKTAGYEEGCDALTGRMMRRHRPPTERVSSREEVAELLKRIETLKQHLKDTLLRVREPEMEDLLAQQQGVAHTFAAQFENARDVTAGSIIIPAIEAPEEILLDDEQLTLAYRDLLKAALQTMRDAFEARGQKLVMDSSIDTQKLEVSPMLVRDTMRRLISSPKHSTALFLPDSLTPEEYLQNRQSHHGPALPHPFLEPDPVLLLLANAQRPEHLDSVYSAPQLIHGARHNREAVCIRHHFVREEFREKMHGPWITPWPPQHAKANSTSAYVPLLYKPTLFEAQT